MGRHPRTTPCRPRDTAAGRDGLAALLAQPRTRRRRPRLRRHPRRRSSPTRNRPAPTPERSPPSAALAPRLRAVAVITGRPAGVAVRLGGFAGVPGLEHLVVLGHYGAERWDAATGAVQAPPRTPASPPCRPNSPASWTRSGVWHGTWVERSKGGRAVAVHTRRAADPQAAFDALRAPAHRPRRTPRPDRRTGPPGPGTAPAGHGQGRRPRRATSARRGADDRPLRR